MMKCGASCEHSGIEQITLITQTSTSTMDPLPIIFPSKPHIYLSTYLSIYLPTYLSIYLYIYMYVCMYVYMYIWLCPCIGEIPIAMCHSCRVQQHPIAEVARRPWSRMCLGPQWAVLSTKKTIHKCIPYTHYTPQGAMFLCFTWEDDDKPLEFCVAKIFFLGQTWI